MTSPKEIKDHRDFWDRYVEKDFPRVKASSDRDLEIPGDEWMPREFWNKLVPDVLLSRVPSEDAVLVEIGSGAGKQTKIVLDNTSGATIYVFDISQAFIDALKEYIGEDFGKSVLPTLLKTDHLDIVKRLDDAGMIGKVDAVYSFDAMVHVDLQALVVYFISAALSLKAGGYLIMDVANAESAKGFDKLINDAKIYYHYHGAPCSKFMFISPITIQNLLERLGFEIEFLNDPRGHCLFAAKLVDQTKIHEALGESRKDWEL